MYVQHCIKFAILYCLDRHNYTGLRDVYCITFCMPTSPRLFEFIEHFFIIFSVRLSFVMYSKLCGCVCGVIVYIVVQSIAAAPVPSSLCFDSLVLTHLFILTKLSLCPFKRN